MPLTAAFARFTETPVARRGAAAAIAAGVIGAVSIATFSNPDLARRVGDGVNQGIAGAKTVAAMLADRSPGARPDGALASLKPKRQSAVHERALPKIRGPVTAPSPYAMLVAAPPSPPLAPPGAEVPLYNMVAGGPAVIVPPVVTGGGGGTPGGPPILSNIPTPGGGGGGIINPPVIAAAPETPPIPVTPVPEPASWAMMLLGFALLGRALRLGRKAALLRTAR